MRKTKKKKKIKDKVGQSTIFYSPELDEIVILEATGILPNSGEVEVKIHSNNDAITGSIFSCHDWSRIAKLKNELETKKEQVIGIGELKFPCKKLTKEEEARLSLDMSKRFMKETLKRVTGLPDRFFEELRERELTDLYDQYKTNACKT
jgi:hypothetical protein